MVVTTSRPDKAKASPNETAIRFKSEKETAKDKYDVTHIYHHGAVCDTDTVGNPTPENRSPLEIVVNATEGFIPLWASNVTLRWRFEKKSLLAFADPEAAKNYIRTLFAASVVLWGDAVPIRFTEVRDRWDFEIVVQPQANCSPNGCVLASAFFPDGGQHALTIFPTMFQQSRQEQVETLAHEIGHVFGLRHFFALVQEQAFPARIFGKHSRFSIMNYGPDSKMTANDQSDLKALYQAVWTGQMTDINGTPIRLVMPFSSLQNTVLPSAQIAIMPAALAARM